MEIARTIIEARKASNTLKRNGKLGLVPTMGYLHEGHLSLMRRAVEECLHTAVSIFVNPTQFGEGEDLGRYPRNEEGDFGKCEELGIDLIFIPEADEMYAQDATVFVNEEILSKYMCGRDRPTHFRGVLTVVAKLFNIIQPDVAYFGRKDHQQGILIKRMVRDLNFPLEIKLLPIVREDDGLAMSSRNAYLSNDERAQAAVLNQALRMAEKMYEEGGRDAGAIRDAVISHIKRAPLAEINYVEVRDAESLEPIESINHPALVAMAVRFGDTRLIDNTVLGNRSMEVQ
jgi:pantoate--beta-alanine ligase